MYEFTITQNRTQYNRVGHPTVAANPNEFTVSNWRPLERNTLRGFLDLITRSGIAIRGCTYHVKGDSGWIGLPGKPRIDTDGQLVRDENGKVVYDAVIDIPNKATRDRFQAAALRGLEEFLAGNQGGS